jgi:Tol biopolymer transport system component
MKRIMLLIVFAILSGWGALVAQSSADLEKLYAAAQYKETTEGDLKGAVELYRRVAAEAGTNRALAARALLRQAAVLDKLGDSAAAEVYRHVVQAYADQPGAVEAARAKMGAANGGSRAAERTLPAIRPIWSGSGVDLRGRVSRDGRYLTMGDEKSNLAIRDLLTGDIQPLTFDAAGRQYVEHSIWSRDNSRIAYVWGTDADRYEVRTIARTGGAPRVLYRTTEPAWLMPFDWSPDGRTIAIWLGFGQTSQLGLVSAEDGSLRVLKSFDWRSPLNMTFSPDGKYIAYDHSPTEDGRARDIHLIAVDGSREVTAVDHAANDQVLGWFPGGTRLLFTSDRRGTNDVYALDIQDGRPVGEPRALIADVGQIWAPMGFTTAGEFLYGIRQVATDVQLAEIDPATGSVRNGASPLEGQFTGNRAAGEWSPDGTRVAFLSRPPSQHNFRVVSLYTPATRQVRTIPHNLGWFYPFVGWSPDGEAILLKGVDTKGRGGLYRLDVQSGSAKREVESVVLNGGLPTVVSRDGRHLFSLGGERLVRIQPSTGQSDPIIASRVGTFALSSAGDRFAVLLIPEAVGGSAPAATPAPPQFTLATLPVEGGEPTPLLRAPNLLPALAWSPDGQYVYFAQRPGVLSRVSVVDGSRQDLGLKIPGVLKLSVHPDGTRLAISTGVAQPEVRAFRNIGVN